MSRTLHWRELKTGIVALAVIVTIALSVLLFARVGALHGDTVNIYVLTDDAPGVLNGTEVWLAGKKVGLVKDVHFRPITTDTLQRLAIHTLILSNFLPLIRRDAYADIRPGDNLIGSPVVWISAGTLKAHALNSGDTLIEISSGKMKPVGDRVSALGAKVSALADSGSRALALLDKQMASLGNLGRTGIPRIAATTTAMSNLMHKATGGDGTLALAMRGDIGARVAHIRAAKDSIAALLGSSDGDLGRFRKDSSLLKTVGHLRGEVDSLRTMLSGGNGIGRMKSDTSLSAEMVRTRAELSRLMADIKKHPLQYLRF